ncbi:unnamed protein product [Lathyrus sativus]|nr:unnamed protein product [Lathyrus sativus]
MTAPISSNGSWILTNIISSRSNVNLVQQEWHDMMKKNKFSMSRVYHNLVEDNNGVEWSHLLMNNFARPCAVVACWMAYHNWSETKMRLMNLGLVQNSVCNICEKENKTQDHIMFACRILKDIWKQVLNWMNIDHQPLEWKEEVG